MEPQTQRGKDYFVDGGHLFIKQKTNKDGSITYWQCAEYRTSTKCPARISTNNGGIRSRTNQHNHDASPSRVEVKRFVTQVKDRAVNTNEVSRVF
jgi:hypothetical protein